MKAPKKALIDRPNSGKLRGPGLEATRPYRR
jgi:hypothetical protein